MRFALALFLVAFAVPRVAGGPPTGGANTNADVETEILKIDDEKDHAMQRYVASRGEQGGPELDRIYADDLVFVTTHGALITKEQRLEDLRSGNLKFISFGRDSYSFHVYGDTVIMTGRATSNVVYQGKENHIPRRFTNVYIKLAGRWRLVAHQATTIAEP
jgi:ketosteroid isomerase-like protein